MYLLLFSNFFSSLIGLYFTNIFLQNLYSFTEGEKTPENAMLPSFLIFSISSEENTTTVIIASVGAIHCIGTG